MLHALLTDSFGKQTHTPHILIAAPACARKQTVQQEGMCHQLQLKDIQSICSIRATFNANCLCLAKRVFTFSKHVHPQQNKCSSFIQNWSYILILSKH